MGKIVKDYNPNIKIDVEAGISNAEYFMRRDKERISETSVDDIKVLYTAFRVFNKEFFNDELDEPIILIAPNMRCNGKVTKPDEWKKRKYQNTDAIGEENMMLQLSDKVLQYDRIEDVYFELVKTMILQYDQEQEAIYKSKNGKRYKKIVGNNNNYFSERYAAICSKCGLVAEAIMEKNDDGKMVFTHKYDVKIGERFMEVISLNKLAQFKLTCRKKEDNKKQNKQQKMRVFKCPECGLIVRIKQKDKEIKLMCYTDEYCRGQLLIEKND